MSSETGDGRASGADSDASEGEASPPSEDPEAALADLRTRVEVLREENRRLRKESRRLTQARYRQTALGLLGVAAVAAVGGLLFPAARSVFVVLAGIGAFGAVLTYYLTPERFIAASVGDRVYATLAANGDALVEEFALTDHRVYVPTGQGEVRLFVPQHEEYAVPDAADLDRVAVVPEDRRERGVALEPTGQRLHEEFERSRVTDGSSEVAAVADGLADAVVEQFELAAAADPEVDAEDGQVTVAVHDSALGAVTRFDHPVASLVATGLASDLERPVRLTAEELDEAGADAHVTCRWSAEDTEGS
ncbi:hypothetical protein [Salinirussus salinus]|uniref:hypothetical protein n=1 Tax=Salinirussus salinus TaxID=1198300 RepID=UPI001915F58E|nr:hypothetical protein [Salinirussus salinus]